MVNVTYDSSGSMISTGEDGTVVLYNPGDIAWTLTSTALVWFMIPGVGFFYSGLLRRKNALSMIYMSVMVAAVASVQWFFWGYSLVYSDTGGPFIGDLRHFALRGVLDQPSMGNARIPAIVFCIYQLTFAAFTPGIALGAVAERGRLGPMMVFTFLWATLVYDPIAHWLWNTKGWSNHMGGLDFAGGTPVHVSSGTAALAISLYLRPRLGYGTERLAYKPNNTSYICLGTAMMWFGWFGFNGGSALSANMRAASACMVTNLAAAVGGLTWVLWDWRLDNKWSSVGFCSGALAGLVAITPAAGFVGPPAATLFGIIAGTLCNFATQLKFFMKIDDTLDIFAAHGVGGIVGNLLTGIFAQSSIALYDGSTHIPGGWLDGNFVQIAYQLADSAAGFAYAFVVTTAILWMMHFVPGLRMRVDEETEIFGVDDTEMGETAYDYVNVETEINPMQTCTREMSARAESIASGM